MSNPSTTHRWGMVVDINRCVGCQTCTVACKHANDTAPGVQWRSVLDIEHGSYPDVQREFLVVGCQHCAQPPCVPVCPTGATVQRDDGLVTMDYDLCIGCAYCAVACPYQARTIVHDRDWYFGRETAQEQKVTHEERLGVAQKCTFCIERVDEGIEHGYQPGKDLDYTPACAASCVAQALTFGDFNDPESQVSRLVADNASFQMHAELGTDPQIKYLYELETTPGRDPAAEERQDDVQGDPSNPMAGKLQTFWDYRAAMNFIMGGMGSGLMVITLLFFLAGELTDSSVLMLYGIASVSMAIGLFFVFMEIGRKSRFLYVVLRPQSSWMTRETYAAGVIYTALLLDLVWPAAWLHCVIGVSGFVFLFSQARILYAAKGVPAWRAPLIPWMIIASGLLEGAGLYLLIQVYVLGNLQTAIGIGTAAMLLVILCGVLWIAYRKTARGNGIPLLARGVINRFSIPVMITGYIIPLIGFSILDNPAWSGSTVYLLTGSTAMLGGAMWKYAVITRASYQQGFAIPKVPQRGSGTRAAPARLNYKKSMGKSMGSVSID